MTGLVLLGGVTNARAQGLELGARAGYAVPAGKVDAGDSDHNLGTLASGMVPLQLDIGYRIIPGLTLGSYVMYGFGFTGSQLSGGCDANEATGVNRSCSLRVVRLGMQAKYHFKLDSKVSPWIGTGLGYEWLTLAESISNQGRSFDFPTTVHGWEVVNLQLGADFALGSSVGLGPMFSLAIARFRKGSTACTGACTGVTTGSWDIENKAFHEWLMVGVHAWFVL